MVAALNQLTTVLNATSPLVLANENDTALAQQSTGSVLTPASGLSEAAANVAYSYVPPGNIALLSRPGDTVLLTQEALEQSPVLAALKDKFPPPINESFLAKAFLERKQNLDDLSAIRTPDVSPPTFAQGGVKEKSFTSFDFSKASASFTSASKLSAEKPAAKSFDISV